MAVVFLILAGLFNAVSCFFDYSSSLGKYEGNRLVRGKDGRISLKKYATWQIVCAILVLVITLYWKIYYGGALTFAGMGAFKLYQAFVHNPKVSRT